MIRDGNSCPIQGGSRYHDPQSNRKRLREIHFIEVRWNPLEESTRSAARQTDHGYIETEGWWDGPLLEQLHGQCTPGRLAKQVLAPTS